MTTTFSPGFSRDMLDLDGVAIVQQLQAQGFETYFVGGCVRDLLLKRRPKDFDVATEARPEELKRVFGRRCRIIGRRFRLAHVHVGSQIYEIATFRGLPADQEMAADDSGFVVRANTFGTPYEDAKSRDFTVNGLFYDPVADTVIDHVGGADDVRRRVLRTIGEADKRLREDPVRLLRAIKFASRLGFSIDQPILDAAKVAAPLVATCPAARVAEELYRMGESGHARAAFEWMQRLGVLDALLPEIAGTLERSSERHVSGRSGPADNGDGPQRTAAPHDQGSLPPAGLRSNESYPALPAGVLAWLSEIDRLNAAHGTLPREATFALIAWPFVLAELERRDAHKLSWGRFAMDGVRELAVRLSVPVRHRYTLAGMADVLKRLRQQPARRPGPAQLKTYGVPLALTAQRMTFLLTGEGRDAYELWAAELERLGLWAAPFEPRHEDDEGGERSDAPYERPRAQHRAAPQPELATRAVNFPTVEPTGKHIFPVEPVHDERALDDVVEAADVLGASDADGPKRRRRRRRRRGGAARAAE